MIFLASAPTPPPDKPRTTIAGRIMAFLKPLACEFTFTESQVPLDQRVDPGHR
jgi:hypothetical protein